MSSESVDCIQRLLTVNPQERLGAKGVDEIKQHPFFNGLDWDHITSRPGPYIPPKRADITDTSAFDARSEAFSMEGLTLGVDDVDDDAEAAEAAEDPAQAAIRDRFRRFSFINTHGLGALNF